MILLALKTMIILAVILVFYKLVIARESFFAVNRTYLLIGIVVTFSLPFISLPQLVENQGMVSSYMDAEKKELATDPIKEQTKELIPAQKLNETEVIETESAIVDSSEGTLLTKKRSLIDWLILIYLFGVIVLTINLMSQIISLLLKVWNAKDKIHDDGAIIINSDKIKEPCSFLKYIFINPASYDLEVYEQVIAHEKIHVKKRHSFDLIISEIAVILLWFNPFIWWFRREVEKNLEYQTDNDIVDSDAVIKDQYQLNLLKIATYNKPLAITTNYNQSMIKQRILKMNSKKSNPHSYWKYTFIFPIYLALILFLNKPNQAFANTQLDEINTELNEVSKQELQEENIVDKQREAEPNEIKETATHQPTDKDCTNLLEAIRNQDVSKVTSLIKTSDVNCVEANPGYEKISYNGGYWKAERAKTPLLAAARLGNVEIAKLLVNAGAKVDLSFNDNGSALLVAASYGHLDFIKYVVEQGAKIDAFHPNIGNGLIAAANSGEVAILKYFIDQGLDINFHSPNQGTALIAAANNGFTEAVNYLLSKGGKINNISPNQGNSLIAAANNGHVETIKLLHSKGASIDLISPNQGSALIAASNNGHLEAVKYLLSKGASIDLISPNQGNALIAAANNGHLSTIKYLIEKGADINRISPNQGTALIAATNNGHKETANYLLSKGANVNTNTSNQGNALVSAAENGQKEMVALLLKKGADVNRQNDGQGSALTAAARNGYNSTLELLLDNGATIDAQTNGQGSALNAAARNGYERTVLFLLERGANIDLQNDGQGSALNAAARNGHLSVVKLLVKKGANINLRSDGQGSARDAALRNGHQDVVKFLEDNGAVNTNGN